MYNMNTFFRIERSRLIALSILLMLAIALVLTGVKEGGAFRSVEVAFTDGSMFGLQIVPASCESNPPYYHYNGDCGTTPNPPALGGCAIASYPQTITSGGGAKLSWSTLYVGSGSATFQNGKINPGDITAGATGSRNVSPTNTTTYTLTGSWSNGATFQPCSVTVTVTPELPGGGACIAQYFCQGSSLYFKNSQCSNQFIQTCPHGCAAGACLDPDAPTIDFRVRPQLVRSGTQVTVTWSGTDLQSCQVTSDHGDSWSGISGTKTSKAITRQTVFTISCAGELEGSSVIDSKTVDVIPVFDEQ